MALDTELQRVLAHEQADEAQLHPQIADLIGGRDPMAAISRTHREIAHLGRRFSRLVADLPAAGPDADEITELRTNPSYAGSHPAAALRAGGRDLRERRG